MGSIKTGKDLIGDTGQDYEVKGKHLIEAFVDSGITLAKMNGLELWGAYLGNIYLTVFGEDKIAIIGDKRIGVLEGHTVTNITALYGLLSSKVPWYGQIMDGLQGMGIQSSKKDPKVWVQLDNDCTVIKNFKYKWKDVKDVGVVEVKWKYNLDGIGKDIHMLEVQKLIDEMMEGYKQMNVDKSSAVMSVEDWKKSQLMIGALKWIVWLYWAYEFEETKPADIGLMSTQAVTYKKHNELLNQCVRGRIDVPKVQE